MSNSNSNSMDKYLAAYRSTPITVSLHVTKDTPVAWRSDTGGVTQWLSVGDFPSRTDIFFRSPDEIDRTMDELRLLKERMIRES